jgi:hypothetical protein
MPPRRLVRPRALTRIEGASRHYRHVRAPATVPREPRRAPERHERLEQPNLNQDSSGCGAMSFLARLLGPVAHA